MKVLNLQCSHGHDFEGWFASEEDFLQQQERSLLSCPLCADPTVRKMLSAPRLNLAHSREPVQPPPLTDWWTWGARRPARSCKAACSGPCGN